MPTPEFADHFSGHADSYARHRPTYPPELFEAFASLTTTRSLAWDVACGNGQASVGLAAHFDRVVATDASTEQLKRAVHHARVQYACEPAESPSIAGQSVDAVFVAQALHWFRFDDFYGAVRRVARPGAPIVAVLYEFPETSPEIDRLLRKFYSGEIGPFWPGDRRHIDELYATIPWPFAPIEFPVFRMCMQWRVDDMLGYIATWSAVRRYVAAGHPDPLPRLRDELTPLWGTGTREVAWPLHRLAGRV